DNTKPVSHVLPLPAREPSPSFTVAWSGTDTGSGIRDFTIFVADNNGAFTPWLTQTTATQSNFIGVIGHTYGFYSIARDVTGNQENQKMAAEATTQVVVTDASKPTSRVATLPGTEPSPNFAVAWSGTDTGGSGVRDYNIYVSENSSPFAPWLTQTTAN